MATRIWGGMGWVQGFEIKVSRSDFLHELAQPEKREPMERACNSCWFVAPRGVLETSELPDGWGWLELQRNGLRMRHSARSVKRDPEPWVILTMMKRMVDDRWHDRARKPAVLDFPQRIWDLEGRSLTPGQLRALALETFHAETENMLSPHRAAIRKEVEAKFQAKADRLAALEVAISEATGVGHWHTQNASLETIQNWLSHTSHDPMLNRKLEQALMATERQAGMLREALATLHDQAEPQAPALLP